MNIRSLILPMATSILLFALGGWLIMSLPQVPYNVRELFSGGQPLLTPLVLGITFLLIYGAPVLIGLGFLLGRRRLLEGYPLWLMIQGTVVWWLLYMAVPTESIHDIVGSPVLAWPWQLETLSRFVALLAVPSMLMTLVSVILLRSIVARHRYTMAVGAWSGWLIFLLPATYWVVVEAAATDNLVELMAGGGGLPSFLALLGWLFFSVLPGSSLAARLAGISVKWLAVILIILASLPLSYLMFSLGTENQITKYGQTFSAMQFLLSPDRAHLAAGLSLEIRFALMQIGIMLMVFVAQYPFWRLSQAVLNEQREKIRISR